MKFKRAPHLFTGLEIKSILIALFNVRETCALPSQVEKFIVFNNTQLLLCIVE